MRIRKRRLTALILTACLLLSCGARRRHSNAESQEQSQQRSKLAVCDATQRSRDSTTEEWELLLLDTIIPEPSEVKLASGDSLLGVTYPKQATTVRYWHARRRVVQERDSVAQQRTTLERAAQLQSRRQEEVETERQPMERITQRLRIGYLIIGLFIVIGATTLIWRSVWLRTRSILRKDIVLRQS